MTIRSLVLGLFGVVVLSAWCYFNDTVVRPGMMVSSLMPVIAYGGLILLVLTVNPLLRRLRVGRPITGREMAAALALFLIGCGVPGWGLVQLFPMTVMMPHHDNRVRPGWSQESVLELAPAHMLTDVSVNESEALDGYVTGMSEGDKHISFFDVPWYAWRRTFVFWFPLIISMLVAVTGLAAVFHRQWCHHEQLPYPIPVFANALLPTQEGQLNPIFRNRLFWIGFSTAFCILMNNYACRWWPNVLIPIPLRLDFSPLMSLFPILVQGKGTMLFHPYILMPVIGLAYLIGSDVSVSMAVVPFMYCVIAGILANYGIQLRSGKMMALTIEPFIFAGGYFGILVMLLYTGRRYYASVFRTSFGLHADDSVPGHAVLGMRMFAAGVVLFIGQLIATGLDWQLAIPYTFFMLMIYTVVSRAIAETGAFHVGTFVYPGIMIWGMFGARALGPSTMVIMFLVSTVLVAAPGWCAMPFLVQAMKLVDLSGVSVRKTVRWGTVVLVVALAVAVPATIYWQYDRGAPTRGWPRSSSRYPLDNAVEIIHKLKAQGTLEMANEAHGWGRFTRLNPSVPHLSAFAITAGLALVVGLGRLRFARWPLHPVVFLFLGGHQGMLMAFSFGIGWAIKTLVSKYGGGHMYQRLKPLMIGLIAGSMVAKFLPMIIGTVYYLITGHSP